MTSGKAFVRDGSDLSNSSNDDDVIPLLSETRSVQSESKKPRTGFQLRIHRASINRRTSDGGIDPLGECKATSLASSQIESTYDSQEAEELDNVDWKSVLGVCLCLFWIHCQPSEAYLTRYLLRDKHITEDDLDKYVWPVDTYVALATLLPLGFLAEIIGYRLVVFIG